MRMPRWLALVPLACTAVALCAAEETNATSCNDLVQDHIPKPQNEFWSFVAFVRVHNEFDVLPNFIGHYLDEGVDRIVVVDDRSHPPVRVDDDRVTVLRVEGDETDESNQREMRRLLKACRDAVVEELKQLGYTWLAFVDADEFMTTRRNRRRTVAEELQMTFPNATAVLAPWLYFCDTRPHDSTSPITEIKTRQSCDNRKGYMYKHIHSKTLARLSCASHVYTDELIEQTVPDCGTGYRSGVDNSVREPGEDMKRIYSFDISERQVSKAYIVTNHYRFRGLRHIERKCTGASVWSKYSTNGQAEKSSCIEKWRHTCHQDVGDYSMILKTKTRFKNHPPFQLIDGVITQKELESEEKKTEDAG